MIRNKKNRQEIKDLVLNSRLCFFLWCIMLLASACKNSKYNKEGVEAAMKQYDHLIKIMNVDSIAMLYTADGNMGNIARGRDSIRKFLSTFKNVQVLSQFSTTNAVEINGDSCIQTGTYSQADVISGKDTIHVKGEYIANWQWFPGDGWHLRRMVTKPAN